MNRDPEGAKSSLAALLVMAVTLMACGTDVVPSDGIDNRSSAPAATGASPESTEPAASPSPSIPPSDAVAPTFSAEPIGSGEELTCTNAELGFTLSYPDDWHVRTTSDQADICTAFGPQPFSSPEESSIRVINIQGGCYGGLEEPIAEDHFTVAGFPAVRREFESTFNGPGYTFVVDRNPVPACGSETHILLFEADHHSAGGFETNKRVVDRMVATLHFEE